MTAKSRFVSGPRRIFISGVDTSEALIIIKESSLQHRLKDVLRLRYGETVIFVTDTAEEITVRVVDPRQYLFKIEARAARTLVPRRLIHLAIALTKRDAFDEAIRRATELGVTSLQPLLTERSNERFTAIPERWSRLIGEALEVTSWRDVPKIYSPQSFSAWLEQVSGEEVLIADREAAPLSVDKYELDRPLAIAIGPEGGWSETERKNIADRKLNIFSLGPAPLRTETAVAVCLAKFNF